MMGVFMKGMEMPRVCAECFMDPPCCKALSGETNIWKERHPECPLTEVKEPHGGLIDADALKAEFPTIWNSSNVRISSVRKAINHAQIIIEAEGSK